MIWTSLALCALSWLAPAGLGAHAAELKGYVWPCKDKNGICCWQILLQKSVAGIGEQ